jgi:hypothetical protein
MFSHTCLLERVICREGVRSNQPSACGLFCPVPHNRPGKCKAWHIATPPQERRLCWQERWEVPNGATASTLADVFESCDRVNLIQVGPRTSQATPACATSKHCRFQAHVIARCGCGTVLALPIAMAMPWHKSANAMASPVG